MGYPDSKKRPAVITPTDNQIELQALKEIGLDIGSPEILALVKKRLNVDNPFAGMETTGLNQAKYDEKTGKYKLILNIAPKLLAKLKGWKEKADTEIAAQKKQSAPPTTETNSVQPDSNQPKTIKVRVKLPDTKESLADRALYGYAQAQYGGNKSNLYPENLIHIRDAARSAGVTAKISNEQRMGDGTIVDVELSVADAVTVHNLFKKEVAEVNSQIDAINNGKRNSAINQFTEGFLSGAWGSLKGNASMVYTVATDPFGTAWKVGEALVSIPSLAATLGAGIGEAAVELSRMSPVQRQALIDELINSGYTELRDMKVEEAAHKAGEILGFLAMEAILLKGAATGAKITLNGLQALKGTAFAAKITNLAKATKQTIAETRVPIPRIVQPATINGEPALGLPNVAIEAKRLDEIILQMKSSSEKLGMLENGTSAGRKVITETAEEGLSDVAQSGTKALRYEFSKEVLAKVKQRLVTLNVARTELTARIDVLINSNSITSNTKSVLETLKNQLKNGTKQDDLIGALRDLNGKVVRRSGDGKPFQHLDEIQRTINSIQRGERHLKEDLLRYADGSPEFVQISKEIDAMKEMKRLINEFLEIK